MGAVDLVVQVESPPSVAAGLQRVGRAGHQVGAVSPRRDLPQVPRRPGRSRAVVAERMRGRRRSRRCATRATRSTCWPSRSSRWSRMDDVDGRRAGRAGPPGRAVRRRCPTRRCEAVLDMLAGRYPSDEFAELRPRLVWDRVDRHADRPAGRAAARRDQRRHHPRPRPVRRLPGRRRAARRRVGELDEEMVYESRVGDVFLLGSIVLADRGHHPRPGAGHPGARAARADAVLEGRRARAGRSSWAGRSARSLRELGGPTPAAAPERGCAAAGLDEWAAGNLLAYLDEQREATGTLPDDRTIVVERFRDELGDWRLVVHSPFGAPGQRAVGAGDRPRGCASGYGVDVQVDALRRRHRAAAAGHRRRAARRRARAVRAGRDRADWSPPRSAARRCSRPGSASARPGPCCCRAATRAGARRCGSSASGPPSCCQVASEYGDVPDRAGGDARVPAGRVRRARAGRADARARGAARCGWSRSRRRSRRRSPGRCCSATSARSCTRATRRWPSGGPPRCPWTPTLLGRAARAGPSCASCSTRTCWPSSSASCSG